mmetsp:Transcript_13538/g.24526  ORF Transcript_13538/g.24526 Transcript_13538/m.24526 type:complete len:153 (-) Transcript_13538:1755-2213(-)
MTIEKVRTSGLYRRGAGWMSILATVLLVTAMCTVVVLGKTCILTNEKDQYLCTTDVHGVETVSPLIGVEQRIDGTQEEKDKVHEVIAKTTRYLNLEVWSLPHYREVRENCNNSNELCAFWASVGECETNRSFMLKKCALSCRLCLLRTSFEI